MRSFRLIFALALASLAVTFLGAVSSAAEPPSSRIVGGNDATPGEYPFMVALLSKGSSAPSFRQFCGGSLIHSKWVLTAAHCIDGTAASSIQVGIGLHNLATETGEQIDVVRIIPHPDYNASTNDNDIALLELASNSTSGSVITLVDDSVNLTGLTSTAIGWGATSEGGSSSDILQEVDLPVVSNTTCNASYGGITDNMVCAGFAAGGKDACQGDSGGPLIIGGSSAPQLIGATSFGTGCARPDYYGVYARVSKYHTWISNYITFASGTDGPYGLWNGFIDLVNIAELQNKTGSAVTAQVNLYNISGTLVSSSFFQVAANSQTDVIINNLPGFLRNSYGIVQVSNNVSGRIFYYRPIGTSFSDFEFAFGIPLTTPMTGTQFVAFNTFQPSANPGEQGNLVANWFSIVNLSDSTKVFTVRKYSMAGALLATESYTLLAKQRVDIDGGHSNPGPNNVGLLEVIPPDGSTDFLAQLIRYGYSSVANAFDFAFPLIPKPGDSNQIVVPIGSSYSAQNWLEVVNVSNVAHTVAVELFDASSNLLFSTNIPLAAFEQAHLNVSAVLPALVNGQAIITPSSGNRAVSEAMFYFRIPSTGGISAMYGSQASQATASSVAGTFNLFLGMENYLRINNPGSSSVNVNIVIASNFSGGANFNRTLQPKETIQLNLHDSVNYGTIPNSYGTVVLTPDGAIQAEVVRMKPNFTASGPLQFAAPTGFN